MLSFPQLLVEMCFRQVSILLNFCSAFFMEFEEILLMIEHFLEELLSPGTAPQLSATNHLLLKVVE